MTSDSPRLQPTFSEAAVMSIFASVVRGALAAAEDAEPKAPSPTAKPRSPSHVLFQSIDRDLDHWATHVLEGAPVRLKNEFQLLRGLFLKTLEHQMSFGPSRDQPN